MSYTLVPYAIDLDQLRRAVGSKDESLLASVVQARPESFEEAEEDDEAGEEIPLRRALRDLVMGSPPAAGSAHQFGYALERLCDHLGERLDADCWESIRWQVIEATGMEEILTRTGPPVPLPPRTDFPSIGHLTREQVTSLVQRMELGQLKTAAPSGKKARRSLQSWLLGLLLSRITHRQPMTEEDVRELLDEYEGWLKKAAETKRGLVFFYY